MRVEDIVLHIFCLFRKSRIHSVLALALFLPFLLGSTGCPNIFLESAKKETDEALLFKARRHMDKREYVEAITAIQSMTTEGKSKRSVQVALASAYAGSCGVDLIDLADRVSDGAAAGQQLLATLLQIYGSATSTEVAACENAEATLLAVGATASERSADENVLLAFVEFAKIGSVLGVSGADADDDGTVDVAFESCTNDSDNISDDDVKKVGTGITIAMASLSGTGIAGDTLSSFSAMCSTIDTVLGVTGFCEQTSGDDFDATEVKGLRALIKSNEIGFNTCGGAVGSSLACTCL